MRQFYIDKHRATEEKRMERAAKQQERLQREREENPPDARAISVTAAVIADELILDLLEIKPRPVLAGGVETIQTISAIEIDDLGPLFTALRFLEEQRPIQMRDWGHARRAGPSAHRRSCRSATCERTSHGSNSAASSRSRRAARSTTARSRSGSRVSGGSRSRHGRR